MINKLVVLGAGALAALAGISGAGVGGAYAATPTEALYRGKAAALIPAEGLFPAFQFTGPSSRPITPGSRTGLTAMAGAEYEYSQCATRPEACKKISLRVMVFKTSRAALTYWKQSCPGCSYRKDRRGGGGWPFWTGTSPVSGDAVAVAVCTNVVIAARGVSGTPFRETARPMFETAVASGMQSCDQLKQEPASDVFARGIGQDRGKAVAVGTIKNPSHIFLRVRANGALALYVEWTLTCTNGTRTETTSDQGRAGTLPLYIELPIGIAGARSCSATGSAVSTLPSNYSAKGTFSIELLNKP